MRNDIAAVIPVPGDKRSIFVVPWYDTAREDGNPQVTYLGTTDTDYDGPLDDPRCTADDVRYLLDATNAILTTHIEPGDVLGTWAGLRPLVKTSGGATKDLSRRHRVTVSDSNVVTITGGKLTTYREMAADTIDAAARALRHQGAPKPGRSRTARLKLHGADGADALLARGMPGAGLDAATLAHLVGRFGTDAEVIAAMVESDPELAAPLVDGLPYLRAEAVFAVRYEMARSVDDVLSRRTRARLLAREASLEAAPDVAALIAEELGLDAEGQAAQVAAYQRLVEADRSLPGTDAPLDPALAGG